MTLTTLITINAALDLAAVSAVVAIVRFTHRLRHDAGINDSVSPSGPIVDRRPLSATEADDLANAA